MFRYQFSSELKSYNKPASAYKYLPNWKIHNSHKTYVTLSSKIRRKCQKLKNCVIGTSLIHMEFHLYIQNPIFEVEPAV